jgi:hypothetical protein
VGFGLCCTIGGLTKKQKVAQPYILPSEVKYNSRAFQAGKTTERPWRWDGETIRDLSRGLEKFLSELASACFRRAEVFLSQFIAAKSL